MRVERRPALALSATTSEGVALVKSTGTGPCLLGRTWGYDATGVWVSDNCGGEFALGQPDQAPAAAVPVTLPPMPEPIETWGEFDPGNGFLVGQGRARRALHQRLRARPVHEPDARRADLHRSPGQHPHGRRAQRHLSAPRDGLPQGVAGDAEARLHVIFWTVNTTDQNARSSPTSAISSAASSASTPASTGIPARARSRARIRTGSATTA